jgi:hypothetical protein
MLSVVYDAIVYAECHNDECRYAESRGAVWGVTRLPKFRIFSKKTQTFLDPLSF